MALPRITVVTPSYNQARFVGWTARSVFLQRYPELEYILMDGGSTDDTMRVLEPYADHFAYLVSERDKGQSDAIARGFARSTGDIMAYLNSDDMLAPGALHYVAKFFEDHPEVDVVYSHRCTVDERNAVLWYWLLPEHDDWYMMRWDLIPQETCFWRRRLFEKVGNVDPTFRFAMDYDLFFRFMQAAPGRTRRLDRFLGVFREHGEAKTSRLMETVGAQEIRRVWERYKIAPGRLDPYRSARFYHGVIRAGDRFAVKRGKLPGALPGVGYNYDQVWGGLLDDGRLPPEPVATSTVASV
jgi:glycosyltransferase involved in cell wall biosynthesis